VVHDAVGQLLTVSEVAGRLRVSRATVYRLVQAGALPVLRISNSIRVPEDALDRDLGSPPSPGLRRHDVEVSSALGRTPRSDHDVHVLAQADDELQEPVGGEAREAPPQ
jgi:excisionase family DNA binding protein